MLVVIGAGALVATVARIQDAADEDTYFRLSIRFWAVLAAVGVGVALVFVHPVLALLELPAHAGSLTITLIGLPVVVVIVAGVRNAVSLRRAWVRRRRAIGFGDPLEARVIARSRRLFGHDLLDIVVEAEVPEVVRTSGLPYRGRTPLGTRIVRFVETCPGDQWARFRPGRRVRLLLDPRDVSTYAVVLFDPA
jgi:uncharacterized membrane protein YvlD (DUF360 family)